MACVLTRCLVNVSYSNCTSLRFSIWCSISDFQCVSVNTRSPWPFLWPHSYPFSTKSSLLPVYCVWNKTMHLNLLHHVVFWWLLVWPSGLMTNDVVWMSEVEDGSKDWEAEESEQRLDWCSRPAPLGFDVESWCVSGFMYIAVYKLLCVCGTPQILLCLLMKRKRQSYNRTCHFLWKTHIMLFDPMPSKMPSWCKYFDHALGGFSKESSFLVGYGQWKMWCGQRITKKSSVFGEPSSALVLDSICHLYVEQITNNELPALKLQHSLIKNQDIM